MAATIIPAERKNSQLALALYSTPKKETHE